MTDSIAVALVGCGHMFHSPFWAEALREDPRVDFCALWDHDEERARARGADWGVPVEPDLDRLLARRELKAVAVCAENNRHAELICRAALAGKYVFCEKPPAVSFRELDEIEKALDKGGVTYFQSFPKRFDPVNLAVKKILTEGSLGRIGLVRMRHGHFAALRTVSGMEPYRNGWFTDPKVNGGGSFLDEGVHAMDCLHWFCGAPRSVRAKIMRLNGDSRVDEGGVAVFTYPNGMPAEVCTGSIFAAAPNTLEVYGERGALVLQGTDLASKDFSPGDGRQPGDLLLYRTDSPERKWTVVDVPTGFKCSDFHKRAIRAFVDCLLEGTPPQVTLADGRKAVEMVMAGYEAARTGCTVEFPFKEDRPYDVEELLRK